MRRSGQVIVWLGLAWLLVAFGPGLQAGSVHGRAKSQPRPALSGPVLSYEREHFTVHYTLAGEDAVEPTDADGNGQPDYVDAVVEALEFSWAEAVERLGWRPPLADRGEGGGPNFDVYLESQVDMFGYVETAGGFVGDNPATAAVERGAAYGYLSLDKDYQADELWTEADPLDMMRTTAAHELHHAIQAAYDDNDAQQWLYEATAVWMEDELYPDIGDARSYLVDYLAAPDLCLPSVGRNDQDLHWYGSWILLRYISEHYGGPEVIRQVWEQAAAMDGLAALETVLEQQGSSLAQVMVDFAVANLTKSTCPANTPYCYRYGGDYLRAYVEHSVRLEPGERLEFTPKDGVQQLGADYLRLKGEGPVRVDFQGSGAGVWRRRWVGLRGDEATVIPWQGSEPITVNPAEFKKLYLVIVNVAPVETEGDCGYHNYSLAFSAGQEAVAAPAPAADPGLYRPPMLGGEAGLGLGDGQPVEAEELPFSPLYPGYLPPGYTSPAQVVRYTEAHLGDWQPDYAPHGEPVLALQYSGPGTDDYLSIIQSATAYDSAAAWAEAQGYDEYYLRLVFDAPVYLADYGTQADPFGSATLVHRGLFVVVEGTLNPLELQQVAAGLLAQPP